MPGEGGTLADELGNCPRIGADTGSTSIMVIDGVQEGRGSSPRPVSGENARETYGRLIAQLGS